MSNQDWSEPSEPHQPPGPLPDGSMPLYGSHLLPGMPGGEPPLPRVGWGPEFGGGRPHHFQHGGPQPKRRSTGLLAGLLVLGGVAALVVIAALALRDGNSAAVAPAPVPLRTALTQTPPDDNSPGTPGSRQSSQDTAKILTADAFYSTGALAGVGCREPQVALNSQATVQQYYGNLVGCLTKTWAPKVRAGQDKFTSPRVIFWSGTIQSPCASGSPVSFYCDATQTIYLKSSDDIKLWNRSPDSANRAFARMWATYTVAREFGHHLQQLTGILPAAHRLEYEAANSEAALEVSRRIELQASCLGTAFMGADKSSYGITGSDLTIYRRYVEAQTGDENNRGGPRDHGSRASHQYWAGRGFNTLDSANCNTFTASASKVS
ncbi:MAG TPA: neutral zinc metallopeptidase [Kribbella sp.]